MTESIRVLQLSDTHFLAEGAEAEGGFAYDTSEAFDAVFEHCGANAGGADMVVVTGDIADHGEPDEYRLAASAFARFEVPVNVCPGNHDFDAPFTVGVARPGVSTSRVVEAGPWAFVFVDSNAGGMIVDETGRTIDPSDGSRLHRNGTLGMREAAWIRDVCARTAAQHVFVWVHHPPAPRLQLSFDADYAAEWAATMAGLPKLRGIGGGHTHVPDVYDFHDVPVFVAPSLKHCFDLDAQTWLPPGYRTYEFGADGSVTSDLHLIDDDRWPRRPLGRALISLFRGELTYDDLAEIAARRAQQGS